MSVPSKALREVGKTGVKIPAIGVSTFGTTDDESSIKLLKKALDIEIYGAGHSEEIISHVIKDGRKDVFLATKFGVYVCDSKPVTDGNPENVFKACEGSLKRLGTDYIDLYYYHRVDPTTPIEATIGAMAELVKQGKVRYLGISECSAQTLRRAHKVHPITAVQMEYRSKKFPDQKALLSSQLALAWDLAQGNDMCVIPGTRKEKNLIDNFAASDVKLTEEEKQSNRNIAESFKVAGERYSPEQLAMVGL
ncbi:putative aldo/keto reductase [Umbelopsis sp. PMI_123]|nr:putative aldo/keto reductase [Umbelopsis sp. PMI_123]